jgi:hypothetical protein
MENTNKIYDTMKSSYSLLAQNLKKDFKLENFNKGNKNIENDFHNMIYQFYKQNILTKTDSTTEYQNVNFTVKDEKENFGIINFLFKEGQLNDNKFYDDNTKTITYKNEKNNTCFFLTPIINKKFPKSKSKWLAIIGNSGTVQDKEYFNLIINQFKATFLENLNISDLFNNKDNSQEDKFKNYFSGAFLEEFLNKRMIILARKLLLPDILYTLFKEGLTKVSEAIENRSEESNQEDKYFEILLSDVYFCISFINDLDKFIIFQQTMKKKNLNYDNFYFYVNGDDYNKYSEIFSKLKNFIWKVSDIFSINISVHHLNKKSDFNYSENDNKGLIKEKKLKKSSPSELAKRALGLSNKSESDKAISSNSANKLIQINNNLSSIDKSDSSTKKLEANLNKNLYEEDIIMKWSKNPELIPKTISQKLKALLEEKEGRNNSRINERKDETLDKILEAKINATVEKAVDKKMTEFEARLIKIESMLYSLLSNKNSKNNSYTSK